MQPTTEVSYVPSRYSTPLFICRIPRSLDRHSDCLTLLLCTACEHVIFVRRSGTIVHINGVVPWVCVIMALDCESNNPRTVSLGGGSPRPQTNGSCSIAP